MSRTRDGFRPVPAGEARGKVAEIFGRLEERLGLVPRLFGYLANSPRLLEDFYRFYESASNAVPDEALRVRISLAVSSVNQCESCLDEQRAEALVLGLGEQQISDARTGLSPDRRIEAALRFARSFAGNPRRVNRGMTEELRRAGYGAAEITGIITWISLTMMMNHFSHMSCAGDEPVRGLRFDGSVRDEEA